jgi:hypothetical protein
MSVRVVQRGERYDLRRCFRGVRYEWECDRARSSGSDGGHGSDAGITYSAATKWESPVFRFVDQHFGTLDVGRATVPAKEHLGKEGKRLSGSS